MKEQAAAVAAELSGKGPAEGVTEATPLSEDAEAFAPASDTAVHPKLRQKAAGISRYAIWSASTMVWVTSTKAGDAGKHLLADPLCSASRSKVVLDTAVIAAQT